MPYSWRRDEPVLDMLSGGPNDATADDPARQREGELLKRLAVYLKAHAETHLGLAPAITEMHSAVAAYHARMSRPYSSIRKVLAVIDAERKADPALPEP